jgi:hypothetical protein
MLSILGCQGFRMQLLNNLKIGSRNFKYYLIFLKLK